MDFLLKLCTLLILDFANDACSRALFEGFVVLPFPLLRLPISAFAFTALLHLYTIPHTPQLRMPRKTPFKKPFRNRNGRSLASSRSVHSTASRRSSSHSTPAVAVRPRAQARPDPLLSTSSTRTPSEAPQRSDVTLIGDDDDDTLDEIVMAVDMTPRGAVGCCYYVARDEKLYFMEDVQLGDVNVVDGRK